MQVKKAQQADELKETEKKAKEAFKKAQEDALKAQEEAKEKANPTTNQFCVLIGVTFLT